MSYCDSSRPTRARSVWLERLYEPSPRAHRRESDPRWSPVAECLSRALVIPGFARMGSWRDRGAIQAAAGIRRWLGDASRVEHIVLRDVVIHAVVRLGTDRFDAFGRYRLPALLRRVASEQQCSVDDLSVRIASVGRGGTPWHYDRDLSAALAEHLHNHLGAHGPYTHEA